MLWGVTYEMLSHTSGYSITHLANCFHKLLETQPPPIPKFAQDEDEAYLLADGLWFGRYFVLLVYRQSKSLLLFKISAFKREFSTRIKKDLRNLLDLGYHFTGVVTDDGPGLVRAVKEVFPHVPHQICLAHMHRRIIAAVGKRPQDERLVEIKNLGDHVWKIESKQALKYWQKKVIVWEDDNWDYLIERRTDQTGHWWYIHSGARKAINLLLELPGKSFAFLDHPLMPKTTNELEGQFGHLGKRWIAHTGLKRERWKIFLDWFVYFYNQKKLSSSKRN